MEPGNEDWGVEPGNEGWGVEPGNEDWGVEPGNEDWGVEPGNEGWGVEPGTEDWGVEPGNKGWGVDPGNEVGEWSLGMRAESACTTLVLGVEDSYSQSCLLTVQQATSHSTGRCQTTIFGERWT